jgi:hypothetical protein
VVSKYCSTTRANTKLKTQSRLNSTLQEVLATEFWPEQSSHVSGDRNVNSRRLHIREHELDANLVGRFPSLLRRVNKLDPELLKKAKAARTTLTKLQANMLAAVAQAEVIGFDESIEFRTRKNAMLMVNSERLARAAYLRTYGSTRTHTKHTTHTHTHTRTHTTRTHTHATQYYR